MVLIFSYYIHLRGFFFIGLVIHLVVNHIICLFLNVVLV